MLNKPSDLVWRALTMDELDLCVVPAKRLASFVDGSTKVVVLVSTVRPAASVETKAVACVQQA